MANGLGKLKRNDLEGAITVYRSGATSPEDVDMLLSLQDDPRALADALADLGERKDWDEDQPRDEAGRFASNGGGFSGQSGSDPHRAPLGTGAPKGWDRPLPKSKMTPAEGQAKAKELFAKANDIEAQTRAGKWEGTGENSGWNTADRVRQEAKEALRAGYDKDKEIENPGFDDFDTISQPGHLYRGMSEDEYNVTVNEGKGVNSDNRYSVKDVEGVSFGYDAGTAASYALGGRSDPNKTGKPIYIVEARANEHMTYNKTAHYPQTAVGKGLPHEHLTRVWQVEARDGKRYMKEIEVPKSERARREAAITKGNIGIPRAEMPQIPADVAHEFLDNLSSKGVTVLKSRIVSVSDLKPTQQDMNMDKVENLVANAPKEALSKPIIVSSDGYVLDGHHRWAALKIRDPDEAIVAHVVNMPIKKLVEEARTFPKAKIRTTKDAADTMKLTDIIKDTKAKLETLDQRIAAARDLARRIDAVESRVNALRADAEWNEEDHPRAEDGKFGSGGGGGKKSEPSNKPKSSAAPSKGLADIGRELQRGQGSSKKEAPRNPVTESKVRSVERVIEGNGPVRDRPTPEPRKGLKGIADRLRDQYKDLDEGRLPEDKDKYFKMRPDTKSVSPDSLKIATGRPGAKERAEERMAKAYLGGPRREPVLVTKGQDGKLEVLDGNHTVEVAKSQGWKEVPVKVVDRPTIPPNYYTDQESADMKANATERLDKLAARTGHDVDAQVKIAEETLAKHEAGLKSTLNRFAYAVGGEGVEISGRSKDLGSALQKVAKKGEEAIAKGKDIKYKTVADLQDGTGMRAVIPSKPGADTIAELKSKAAELEKRFQVVGTDNYVDKPQEGGYRAIHYIVKDKDGLEKEVQLQTRRQQNFQTWSHDVYKPVNDLQREVQKAHKDTIAKYADKVSDYLYQKDLGKDPGDFTEELPEPVRIAFGTPRLDWAK